MEEIIKFITKVFKAIRFVIICLLTVYVAVGLCFIAYLIVVLLREGFNDHTGTYYPNTRPPGKRVHLIF